VICSRFALVPNTKPPSRSLSFRCIEYTLRTLYVSETIQICIFGNRFLFFYFSISDHDWYCWRRRLGQAEESPVLIEFTRGLDTLLLFITLYTSNNNILYHAKKIKPTHSRRRCVRLLQWSYQFCNTALQVRAVTRVSPP
jgi:hypothetical protein